MVGIVKVGVSNTHTQIKCLLFIKPSRKCGNNLRILINLIHRYDHVVCVYKPTINVFAHVET